PITAPAIRMMRRQPKRAVMVPVSGMAASDPMPMQRSNAPKVASSIASRDFAYGTSGAQAAIARPDTKKTARVAACAARSAGCDDTVGGYGDAAQPARTFRCMDLSWSGAGRTIADPQRRCQFANAADAICLSERQHRL